MTAPPAEASGAASRQDAATGRQGPMTATSVGIEIRPPSRILVCGATGYVGGRLVPRLLEAGYRVRCLARVPKKLDEYTWRDHPGVEVIEGDLNDPSQTAAAVADVDAAYYLVHSMIAAGQKYARCDRELAQRFAAACRDAGVRRVVYLGGLGETGRDLSQHLASRREVEQVLRDHGVPTTVLRAAMIIGSGSASFEILRYLVDRLPVMVVPKWVSTRTQPIAIRDVLRYLMQCLTTPQTTAATIDIGGTDVVTYRAMMELMTGELGLPKRWILPLPFLSTRLSSRWIGLVTPVTSKIARPLAEGLRNPTVCRDDRAIRWMPGPLFTVQQSVRAALGKIQTRDVETRWSTAGALPTDPSWSGGAVYRDVRERIIDAPPEATFAAVCRIGGEHGYWGSDFLWAVRGWMDQAIGGPGLRRGRRDPQRTGVGEVIDFWRVSAYEPGRLLQLHAEMWLPGEAELQFQVQPIEPKQPGGPQRSSLQQMARFRPRGLLGLAYWYAVCPLHEIVFPIMLRGIRKEAIAIDSAPGDAPPTDEREADDPLPAAGSTT